MKKLLIPFTLIFTFLSVLLFSDLQVNAFDEADYPFPTNQLEFQITSHKYYTKTATVIIRYPTKIYFDQDFVVNVKSIGASEIEIKKLYFEPNLYVDVNGDSRNVNGVDIYISDTSKLPLYLTKIEIRDMGEIQPVIKLPEQKIITYEIVSRDNYKPVFDGQTAFVTNVDAPMSELEIRSHITAFDNEDGDLTNKIKLEEDNYTPNKNRVGEYTILYSVTDSAGNRAELTVYVLVRDVVSPVITGKSSYTTSMTTLFDVSTIINDLTVTDNYDNDLVITISSDNYTKNYNKVGTYEVIFKATDSSNNTGYLTVKITVIDDVKPVINGPTKIVKGTKEILTLSDIKAQLTASDNVDGLITDKIEVVEDLYTGNGNKVGIYTIKFKVSDSSGNETEKIVTIEVIDDIPPVFFVDNYFITVNQSVNLTIEDIIDLLVKTGQFSVNSQTTVMTVLDEYTGNEKIPGMYAMTFRVKSVNGNESEHSVVVNVVTDETNDLINLDPIKENSSIWDYIVNAFKWLWNTILLLFKKIVNFFKSLF